MRNGSNTDCLRRWQPADDMQGFTVSPLESAHAAPPRELCNSGRAPHSKPRRAPFALTHPPLSSPTAMLRADQAARLVNRPAARLASGTSNNVSGQKLLLRPSRVGECVARSQNAALAHGGRLQSLSMSSLAAGTEDESPLKTMDQEHSRLVQHAASRCVQGMSTKLVRIAQSLQIPDLAAAVLGWGNLDFVSEETQKQRQSDRQDVYSGDEDFIHCEDMSTSASGASIDIDIGTGDSKNNSHNNNNDTSDNNPATASSRTAATTEHHVPEDFAKTPAAAPAAAHRDLLHAGKNSDLLEEQEGGSSRREADIDWAMAVLSQRLGQIIARDALQCDA